MPPGSPYSNGAGFEYGQENIYFRIGLVLAILKVVFPDLGLPKQIFIIRETFINRGKWLIGTEVGNDHPEIYRQRSSTESLQV